MTFDLQQKFDSSYQIVSESGCWIWTGAVNKDGYGVIQHNYKLYYAHRLSRLIAGDDIDGKTVCHTCDTPSCVNPDHLYCGTPADNVADMVRRGRINRIIPVDEIDAMINSGKPVYEEAARLGVSSAMISKIRRNNGVSSTPVGSDVAGAKMTDDDILSIYHSKDSVKNLADKYGLNPSTISKIRLGKRWAWLTNPRAAEPHKSETGA